MTETQIVFTCQQESEELCVNELLNTGWNVKFNKWIDHGAGIINYQGTFLEFAGKAKEKGFIFLRHIFPVDYLFSYPSELLEQEKQEEPKQRKQAQEKEKLECKESKQENHKIIWRKLVQRMCKTDPFSIQFRCKSTEKENQIQLTQIRKTIEKALEEEGFCLQVKHPIQVISGYLSQGYLYLGLSFASDNLSDWSGGMCTYAFLEDTISRAEFKLMEVIESFSLSLPEKGLAVDLGAAPGGWTKVLLEHDLKVIAVDPAKLSEKIQQHPNVIHYSGLAQRFLEENQQQFDLIVNDMRMDIVKSVEIMNRMADRLKQDGYIIMTFKLQKTKKTAAIRKGLELLSKKYKVIHAKQLFHNRSEITVVARKKE